MVFNFNHQILIDSLSIRFGMKYMVLEWIIFYMRLSKHANHMTMTTSGQIMPWSDCLKTKGNVKIKLCETLIVYILLSIF